LSNPQSQVGEKLLFIARPANPPNFASALAKSSGGSRADTV